MNSSHIAIVKSTVPLLEVGGKALTTHFYKKLLSSHPSLKETFNLSNQGTGRQPAALARAVLCYAKNVDNLAGLGNMPAEIITKHIAFGVTADQYPLVGAALLESIVDVLGADVATPPVIEAWGLAYQALADVLIAAESKIYEEQAEAAKNQAVTGAWVGARDFELTNRREERGDVLSLTITPKDDNPVISFVPGQYLTLHVHLDGMLHRRNYSIARASNGKDYTISVKKDGLISKYLHNLELGSTVKAVMPMGCFNLSDSNSPVVLVAGGIGITPLLSMAQTIASKNATTDTVRKTVVIHSAKNESVRPLAEELQKLVDTPKSGVSVYAWESNTRGHLTSDDISKILKSADITPTEAEMYSIGPHGFMTACKNMAADLGVPHFAHEFFGPTQDL